MGPAKGARRSAANPIPPIGVAPARSIGLLACLLLLGLSACAGWRGDPGGTAAGSNSGSAPVDFRNLPTAPAGSIGLALASLEAAESQTGTLRISLRVNEAAQLYQLSCRITYNPQAVAPRAVQRGVLVDSRAVFFAPLEAAAAEAYLPLAFSYHPGEAIPAASGELASLEFDVLDAGLAPGIAVLTEEQYLIARNSLGQPLAVKLEVAQ
jgi:hypothetical protein